MAKKHGKEILIPATSDRLTALPDDLLHSILSFLPLKTIVRTSILSKEWETKWMELWVYSAKLEFGRQRAQSLSREGYADFVEKILKHHKGFKVEKFQLYFYPGREFDSLSREWIEIVLAKGVEELHLNFRGIQSRNIRNEVIRGRSSNFEFLPDSFYSSSSITSLSLRYCSFIPPPNSLVSFRSLKSIALSWVKISGESISEILYHSPLLEELFIKSCGPLEATKIDSPKMKRLTIDCCWDFSDQLEIFAPNLEKLHFTTHFSETPVLREVSSLADVVVHVMDESESLCGLRWLRFLSGLAHVSSLSLILHPYPENAVNVPNITFQNLRELSLNCFLSPADSFDICMFFTSCAFPQMEKLTISLPVGIVPFWLDGEEGDVEDPELSLECEFRMLREIKIRNFLGREHEMKLVELLLGITPVLEKLVLEFPLRSTFDYIEVPSGDIYTRLPAMPRASPEARIVFNQLFQGYIEAQKAMEERGKEFNISRSCDRLTYLPDNLLHSILSLLPVKTIVQTSILSKSWENKWKELWICSAKLEFGRHFAPSLSREGYAVFVDKILKLHEGEKIETFQFFFFPGEEYSSATRDWIQLVLAKGVQELELDFKGRLAPRNIQYEVITGSSNYRFLPDSLYSSSSITYLSLTCCCFLPPPNSTGFASLNSITLNWVNITGETIAAILNHSPCLEELVVKNCGPMEATRIVSHQLKHLTIDSCWEADPIEIFAPNVEQLCFSTQLCEIPVLRDVSSLVDAVVHVMDESELLCGVSWLRFLCGLSHEDDVNVPNNITFHNLLELNLYCFYNEDDSYDIRMFFTCCSFPLLEKLIISLPRGTPQWLGDNEEGDDDEDPEEVQCDQFERVREIHIRNFAGREHEMKLVELLLGITPVLQILVLEFPFRPSEYIQKRPREIFNQLQRIPKACAEARIIFRRYIMDGRQRD
ncbi:hypothetical protein H6P81_020071 [Aristolochia fimbriata]|uniref:F-box domain-containing protein n=1 Tax=Aristolochia fimbriata TaxID=158543 RepID=A0AAV7DWF5_ARIFI|nr:hypothetical protein H6P81_020071 [Aristolochia fimbriata]